MPERVLLDTNAAIAYLNGDLSVQRLIRTIQEPSLCPAVIGELVYGAMRSQRIETNLANIDRLLEFFTVLPCTRTTAMHYGKIRSELANIGRPIPNNDAWIGASALEHALAVVTRDEHFMHIKGLSLVAW